MMVIYFLTKQALKQWKIYNFWFTGTFY